MGHYRSEMGFDGMSKNEKRMRLRALINYIFLLVVVIAGGYLIVHYGSWQLLVGIFLLMWANNFMR